MKENFHRGMALLKLLVFVPAALAAIGVAWYGYVEYRRSYWDDRVKEMCAKEGGIKVFERVTLTDKRYLDPEGNIRIPIKLQHLPGYGPLPSEAKADDLFYERIDHTVIRSGSPTVVRDDVSVFRSSDERLLGRAIYFGRVGGDFIAIDFESRFRCPPNGESEFLKNVFVVTNVQGDGK